MSKQGGIFATQSKALSGAVNDRLKAHGEKLSKRAYEAAMSSLIWIDYLRNYELTGNCDEHLEGWRAAIVETVGCVSMGLIRPAIFGMRTQIDLALAWLYFKDHPVEWRNVEEHGEGFMLKGDVIKYLEASISLFRMRHGALTAKMARSEPEPYRLLSAHVHAQSTLVLPAHTGLATMVQPLKRCEEAIKLQSDVSEYVSDALLAYFGSSWASLPDLIMDGARKRLGKDAHKVFG